MRRLNFQMPDHILTGHDPRMDKLMNVEPSDDGVAQCKAQLIEEMALSEQERHSFTKTEFWIEDEPRTVYQRALQALNDGQVPYILSGAFAIHHYTGIYRETKDLDLFFEPENVVAAARVLKEAGFRVHVEQPHWVAKATMGEYFVDMIYGIGNGLGLIDADWFRNSHPAILADQAVKVAPPEEMIWHRLFISERHRNDMADTIHLIYRLGGKLDWERLVARTGDHWPLLLCNLLQFRYIYPGFADYVPDGVLKSLLDRAEQRLGLKGNRDKVTRGTLMSLFSFQVDVKDWGFQDLRMEAITRTMQDPRIGRLIQDPVWEK